MLTKDFAQLVKSTRKILNESQAKFGKRFGVKQQAVYAWETGRNIADGKTVVELLALAETLKSEQGDSAHDAQVDTAKAILDLTTWLQTMYPGGAVGGGAVKMNRRSTDKPPRKLLTGENSEVNVDSKDTEIREALNMAETILRSMTIYSNALMGNIKAFSKALKTDEEIQGVKGEIQEMKQMLQRVLSNPDGENHAR